MMLPTGWPPPAATRMTANCDGWKPPKKPRRWQRKKA